MHAWRRARRRRARTAAAGSPGSELDLRRLRARTAYLEYRVRVPRAGGALGSVGTERTGPVRVAGAAAAGRQEGALLMC